MLFNKIPVLRITLIFIFLVTATTDATGQLFSSAPTQAEETQQMIPVDSLGRENPRGTVNGFLKAISEQNYIRASNYLELKRSRRNKAERERVVKVFQRLLDQGGNIEPIISNKSSGNTDDGLAPYTDLVGSVNADGEVLKLFVQNAEPADAPAVWLFTIETVEAVAAVTNEDVLLVDKVLPQVLKDRALAGVPLGHWLAVIVLIAVAYLLSWSIISIISLLIRLFWRKARAEPTRGVAEAFELPFKLYIAVWIFVSLSQQAGISIIVRQRFNAITITIGIIAILLLLWRLTDFISNFSKERMSRKGRVSAISVILFLRRTTKVALIVLGCIAILGAVGVDVTTGLAALGIGGLALALGAQKTIENFVGSVTLITDQPLRVGDYCKIGDISGSVEQVGMRSTKIRTGERTVVTIPNGDLAASRIENFAHRDRFLFSPVIEVRYETTPDQMRYLLVELRTLLYSHSMVNPDPAKVRFTGFGESALKLEFWAYVNAANFDQFQEVQEDLLLRIMDIVAASGSDFAFPSQTIYMARDKGTEDEKANEVAEKVKDWKDHNELQLPAFGIEKINEIKNTIKYPPEGSVKNKNNDDKQIPEENKL